MHLVVLEPYLQCVRVLVNPVIRGIEIPETSQTPQTPSYSPRKGQKPLCLKENSMLELSDEVGVNVLYSRCYPKVRTFRTSRGHAAGSHSGGSNPDVPDQVSTYSGMRELPTAQGQMRPRISVCKLSQAAHTMCTSDTNTPQKTSFP